MPLPTAINPGDPGHVEDHEEIHALLDDVDQVNGFTVAQILQGTLAARPAAGTARRWYFATDGPTLYYDNGSAWQEVATTGTLAAHVASAAPHSGEIADAIIDAKGDLIIGTAADTPARLGVGANDRVLVADSAQAEGAKWARVEPGSMALNPGCKIRRVANQSIPDSADTAVVFDTEDVDDDAMFTTGGGAGNKITIVTPGRYSLVGQVSFAQDADGRRIVYWRKNGSEQSQGSTVPSASALFTIGVESSDYFDCIAGDYFEFMCFHNAGAALNVTARAHAIWHGPRT